MNPAKQSTREIVVSAIADGLTSKEAAFRSGKSVHALLSCANRLGVSFPWSGMGRPPKHPKPGSTPYRIDPNNPVDRALVRIVRLAEMGLASKYLRPDLADLLTEAKSLAETQLFRGMQSR